MDNEELSSEIRNITYLFKDLEMKFESQIEELELLQNELEE